MDRKALVSRVSRLGAFLHSQLFQGLASRFKAKIQNCKEPGASWLLNKPKLSAFSLVAARALDRVLPGSEVIAKSRLPIVFAHPAWPYQNPE